MSDANDLFVEILIMQETQNENENLNISDGLSERFGRDAAVSIMASI